jgi:DNA-binding response OmpR family regulator
MARIAIVDDSRLARTFTVSCLKKQGHELQEIDPTGIFDVLKILKGNPPDLLLMDYLMPNCPGMSLVRTVREDLTLKTTKILVITAHRDEEVQERLSHLGADAFLHKPFEPQALVDAVQELLSRQG